MKQRHIYLGGRFYDKRVWNSDLAFPTALSKYGNVLYVPYNFTFLRGIFKGKKEKTVLYNFFSGQREIDISNRLKIVYPFPLFHLGTRNCKNNSFKDLIYQLETRRLAKSLKLISRKYGFSNAIIWSSTLNTHQLRRFFPHNKIIYYVVDDWRYYDHKDAAFVEKNEIKNAQECDFVVTISKSLSERFYSYGAKVIESTIGITLADHDLQIIPEIRGLGKNLVGYVGNLAKHVDYDLVKSMLFTFKNLKLIIIGPRQRNKTELEENGLLNNKRIYCFDSVNIQNLFDYLYSVDICILPFKLNEITRASDPMKMYDYLQSERQTIAMKVNEEMERFQPFAYICCNHRDFLESIKIALKRKSDFEQLLSREKFLHKYSWEERVKKILSFI
jgi:hypothetical protein